MQACLNPGASRLERAGTGNRTQASFEVAMKQLGGNVVMLTGVWMQLGPGKTAADTARVLSRYVDEIVMRADAPGKLTEMARYATVALINGLTLLRIHAS